MAGPWEQYQQPAAGPWQKYAPAPAQSDDQPAVDPEIAKAADAYEKVRGTGAMAAATDAGAKGIPFSDELYSAVSALPNAAISAAEGRGFHPIDEYNRSQALQAEIDRREQAQHPIATTVGSIAGGIGATAPLSAGGLSFLNGAKPTVASLVGRGAAEGAAYGGVYGAGEGSGLGDRATNAVKGMLAGGATGGALGGLSRLGAGHIDTAALPTADDLKAAATNAYNRADDAGVVYSSDALKRVADALQGQFDDFGYHAQLQPGAKVALDEVRRLADDNVTLKGLDTVRKISGNAFQPGNASNNALAAKVTSAIDDLVQNPQAGDVIAGNGAEAANAIGEARNLYSRARKLDLVNSLMDRAGLNAGSSGSGANIENATRQQLKRLLTSDKLGRGFTDTELKAVKQAVLGTPAQNVLRSVGKFAPTGVVSGGIGTSTGAAIGNFLGGPVGAGAGAIALPATGFVAKQIADAGARNSARLVEALIASGGNLPEPTLTPLRQSIVEALTRGAGQRLPAYTSQ